MLHWSGQEATPTGPIGVALLLEPGPAFYDRKGEAENTLSWKMALGHLKKNHWKITQVILSLLIASLLQLIFPFLTQSIVDTGINTQDLSFITVILVAQLMLTVSKAVVDFIRGRLLLQISTILNLSILSDFWVKLTRLPVAYFDNHQTGDTLQRIEDNRQIQNFLTGQALGALFSVLTFLVYSIVLVVYSPPIFLIFFCGSCLYILWIRLFLRIRRRINYEVFHASAVENNATLQLVQGMQEIRMNNAEQAKRKDWEKIQVGIFNLNFRNLTYNQFQQAGALLINQGKDIVITFLSASMVIHGHLTLGAMLAIQYIIGQLSSPVEQFIGFIQSGQDAKISMERLNEIHQMEDEEKSTSSYIKELPPRKDIRLSHVSFAYPGTGDDPVLKDINLQIEEGKVLAIVGASGSGKTTLLKLLLRFYDSYNGDLCVGGTSFRRISPAFWRSRCGAVLQEGYIFNDHIAGNISVGGEEIDYEKLIKCCQIANIHAFIEELPNRFFTKLGAEGINLSQGQKQRILIARALYKEPQYLFFDEATNALDANNEKLIVENLQTIFKGRTVVIVAHRLSTVKNADHIVVLDKGEIVEEGSHLYLSSIRGKYFELVRNQLELGN